MIDAALRSNSDAVHPGWGFLAENHVLARKVVEAGLVWIGPWPEVIKIMGDKIKAKALAMKAHVPTIAGISNVTGNDQIRKWMKQEQMHASFYQLRKII